MIPTPARCSTGWQSRQSTASEQNKTMETLKEIKRAYEKLEWVFNARMTNWAKRLHAQCAEEERGHRQFGSDFAKYHPGAASVADIARMFAVKRVAEYLIGGPATWPKGEQYLHTQISCFIAARIADEFGQQVREAWKDEDLVKLASLFRASCGCVVQFDNDGFVRLSYCPLHGMADDLHDCLKAIVIKSYLRPGKHEDCHVHPKLIEAARMLLHNLTLAEQERQATPKADADNQTTKPQKDQQPMGDRGNIVIEKDDGMFPAPVYLYTHWNGSELKQILRDALIRGKRRWEDPQYLARVIFCEMVKPDPDGITGYGITTRMGDNGHDLVCVNMEKRTITERKRPRRVSGADEELDPLSGDVINQWTFAEFTELDLAEIRTENV